MKLQPCRKCGTSNINTYNCGYSSFDVGYVECLDCGYKLDVQYVRGHESLIKAWNKDKPDDQEILDYLIKTYRIGTRASIIKKMRAKPKGDKNGKKQKKQKDSKNIIKQ